jgi:2-C-methyl-D-erythritol 4-phosphate cytidylyltransferase
VNGSTPDEAGPDDGYGGLSSRIGPSLPSFHQNKARSSQFSRKQAVASRGVIAERVRDVAFRNWLVEQLNGRRAVLSVRTGIWGIVLAAGTGSRFGERKQFLRVADTRPVDLAVRATASACEGLVLVLPRGFFWQGEPVAEVVVGGETRIESARRGLEVVPPSAEIVVIHDAAHPLASQSIFESVIAAVREEGIDAAFPVIATKDTVMRVRQDQVVETVLREGLVTVQTPQAYKARVLRAAHERGREASDDSVLVQGLGAVIKPVPGESINIHITTEDDLAMVGRLLQAP